MIAAHPASEAQPWVHSTPQLLQAAGEESARCAPGSLTDAANPVGETKKGGWERPAAISGTKISGTKRQAQGEGSKKTGALEFKRVHGAGHETSSIN